MGWVGFAFTMGSQGSDVLVFTENDGIPTNVPCEVS